MEEKYKINIELLQELIGFSPHRAQQEILDGQKRFTVVMAGRQVGKSLLVSYMVLRELLHPQKKIWIVAPNYDLTQRIFKNYLLPIALKYPKDFKISMERYRIECKATGSSAECKSADNPVSLLGDTLDLLVIDEAAEVSEEVFERYLRPTLMVKQGRCVLISTPTTRANWFYRKYINATNDEDHASFHYTSYDNPYILPSELDIIKRRTPELTWRQQYLAEPVEDGGKLFTGVRAVIAGHLEEPIPNEHGRYLLGWDPAKSHDYSAVIIVDRKMKHVVHYDRFSGLPWNIQIERVLGLAHKYNNAMIVMDATGQGDPLYENLLKLCRDKGYPIYIEPYKIDSIAKKKELIENLVVVIQNWEITYPKIEQLIAELEEYTYTLNAFGNAKYNAPKGMFDDMVIALALCCIQMKRMPYIDIKKETRDNNIRFVRTY